MPEEGISFFEIPPGKFNPPQSKRSPWILQILNPPPPLCFRPKIANLHHLGGGGVEAMKCNKSQIRFPKSLFSCLFGR